VEHTRRISRVWLKADSLKLPGKSANIGETLLWVFLQGRHHYLLDFNGHRWEIQSQGWRRFRGMLECNLCKRSLKRSIPAEPFIDNHPQCVLIAGRTRVASDLLGSHVEDRTRDMLRVLGEGTMRRQCNSKIAEKHLLPGSQQHVFWLHVAVNEPLVMRIL
jgi:hypothetical protein